MKKPYVTLIKKEDIRSNFGYDLESDALQGGFGSKQDAVNSWLDEAAESIALVISRKMGRIFLSKLNEFVSKEENKTDSVYEALYWAQMYEFRFFYDNGRWSSQGTKDVNRKYHSEEAIQILYDNGLIRDVMF